MGGSCSGSRQYCNWFLGQWRWLLVALIVAIRCTATAARTQSAWGLFSRFCCPRFRTTDSAACDRAIELTARVKLKPMAASCQCIVVAEVNLYGSEERISKHVLVP
jgi:hypothetical protein